MAPLGYQSLVIRYALAVPPLAQTSWLSPRAGVIKHTIMSDDTERIEIPRNRYAGRESLRDQLTFALKRERLNLTVLAALFEHAEVQAEIQAWLLEAPSSVYSRLIAHLAKWLSGAQFEFTLPAGAPRVRVLDENAYIVAPGVADTQLGVVNNLLGTPAFCPLVRRTKKLNELLALNLRERVSHAINGLDPEVLARAIDYLYLAETRSTFTLEKEVPNATRAERFRRLLELAGDPGTLTEDQLCDWQNSIVSDYAAEASFRQSQNWLSRSGRLRNVADFIPPAPAFVGAMMEGVARLARLGADNVIDPAVAAACASFGLVFVHPFMDGNGRLHRFLLHHILRQAGYTPAGVVLPFSARMLKALDAYSHLLKDYSKPRTALLDYVLDDESQTIRIGSHQPLWLYASFDATAICEFILGCVQTCVVQDLAQEVLYLEAYDRAKDRLEAWLDIPQPRLSLLVRLVVQGNGELSQTKQKKFEDIPHDLIARVEEVIREEFESYFEQVGAG